MPLNREWQSRIKAVEREYFAVRQAAEHFRKAVQDEPGLLRENLRPRDILAASGKLEGTYIIRLFAEFETGARQFWAASRGTEPRTADMIDGLAARHAISETVRDNAHLVREHRNALVHEREDEPKVVPMAEARGHLCRFFSFLPPQW